MTVKGESRDRSLPLGSEGAAGGHGASLQQGSRRAPEKRSLGPGRTENECHPDGGCGVVGRGPRPLDEKKLSLWEQYVVANKRRPLETKCITTGVLMATGNVGAQCIMILKGKQKGVMSKKVMAFVVFGVFLSGPLGHAWLKFLNGHKTKLKGQSLILYKIALDRLGYGPAFNLLMMSFVYKLSGNSWPRVWALLRKTFWAAQVLNWKMWPVAQYVNFNFIPPELQLLYMNVVALFWTIGLSIIMN